MLLLIQYTLIFSSVLTLVALGGCISEHSGVINLGLEGIMVMGARGGALTMRYLGTTSPLVMVLLVMLAAARLCFPESRVRVEHSIGYGLFIRIKERFKVIPGKELF